MLNIQYSTSACGDEDLFKMLMHRNSPNSCRVNNANYPSFKIGYILSKTVLLF